MSECGMSVRWWIVSGMIFSSTTRASGWSTVFGKGRSSIDLNLYCVLILCIDCILLYVYIIVVIYCIVCVLLFVFVCIVW